MPEANDLFRIVEDMSQDERYHELHWEGSFGEYLDVVAKQPQVLRTAFQRVYDMIISYGQEEYTEFKHKLIRYKFFSDERFGGRDAVFGLEKALINLVNIFKSASRLYGSERRVLLLHGPVGSAKSTIVRLIKKGLEEYSKTPEGAMYTYGWLPGEDSERPELQLCPMHEEPLHLLPVPIRQKIIDRINEDLPEDAHMNVEGELCPFCRFQFRELMTLHQGDLKKVLDHVRVRRLILSEKDRVGIGTFQPKDEKNQDSTELTGDINYRKIALYGTDSDPRAFNFDGEFNISNRGVIEFVEVLKLDVAFLYDLLGASQEHVIKPKKFPQTDIDEVIIGHTNEPEYKKLQNNEFMEALRDRTIKIDVPYNTRLRDELKIYEKDYAPARVKGKHIAPHTLEMAAMWAILTRLEDPKKANLNLMQKLKLYNGKTLAGYTEDNIKELKTDAPREGMEGISPRYIQDKVSNALVVNTGEPCVNPFMVLKELEEGLDHHSLIINPEVKKRCKELLALTKDEYADIVKNEVQRAISADEEAVKKLCANYIDNIKAYTQREKVRNRYTAEYEEPDERLMRSIEEKIDIPDNRKDDFRREIMNYIGALAVEGKTFDFKANERLNKALELKLFEDQKDTIKLTSLVSKVVDKDAQEKIDVVKNRMIKNYNYCEVCATDVLSFVASIFARGDIKS
ncbi:MAG: serine protein kinase [Deltaproteobacteria bacterium]|nr:serine protein kinase [Deltaproteobacteria bacterium]